MLRRVKNQLLENVAIKSSIAIWGRLRVPPVDVGCNHCYGAWSRL